jgi:D-3-phosphoglycerate dehydrogenase / 2-oxoglutarate reductase
MSPAAIDDLEPARPRILVPEKVSPDGLAMLSDKFEVDNRIGLSAEELLTIIPDYQALIVRSETKVTADVLQAAKNMKVVARAGVGVDNIDVTAATQAGIIVVNSPSGNILAAAEHTIALLLATARNLGRADGSLKSGSWERSKLVGVEVGGKTLGIIGLGKVGMKVARMAIGLGMKVKAVDPYASAEIAKQNQVDLVGDLHSLLPAVDFLTIHTPLIASTLDLLGEKEFQSMRKAARVLNVARGGVYNEEALIKALDEGWIAGAGIDVFTSEPPKPDTSAMRLSQHPKVVSSPHLGASTVEAQENVSIDVCTQVLKILAGDLPTAAVNAPLILPEEYRKLQPFVPLVEKMGGLYTQHYVGKKGGMIGGRKFEIVYHGELAGVANTRPLFAALVKGLVSSITDSKGRDVNIVNATLIAKEKGMEINEVHAHEAHDLAYASLVTLKTFDESEKAVQIIEGYISDETAYISRLDRFHASFEPEGTLLLIHNYDTPGKIGGVGMILGKHSININFMQVASLDSPKKGEKARKTGAADEALMILGISGDMSNEVTDELGKCEGILDVSVVSL